MTGEQNKILYHQLLSRGDIAVDSNYSPVVKVSYDASPDRVGHDSHFDKLVLEVWTNGSILPQEAVVYASQLLIKHLEKFLTLVEKTRNIDIEKEEAPVEEVQYENQTIEELDFSVRSLNCLKRANIPTVKDITEKTEEEMMKVKNLGKKSLQEIKNKLAELGLSLKKSS